MDNFSQPERRKVVDVSAVNNFLTKMYGIMALAVLVSALTAYLTMTVFRVPIMSFFARHQILLWLTLFVPIGLAMGTSFQGMKNPAAAMVMLMLMAVIYGFEFSLFAGMYTGSTIASAFISAAAVFIGMAAYGTFTKRSLSNVGAYASAAIWGLIAVFVVNMFLRNSMINYIFSIIAVVIFTVLTAWDAQKMKQIYEQYSSEISTSGLAVIGAMQLYLDFINIFLYLLEIFGVGDNNN